MNEGAKTGIFWAAALVLLSIAVFVSWRPQADSDTQELIGQPLFPGFTDPLAASSLRIVTFDDTQGKVQRFEVAKDEATGVWSLPSRNNYPADAAEQMQQAANALVGVKILDIQTENAEDHASLGVVEPKPESNQLGDEGIGRLVSFRGEKNTSLASVIIGNRVGESGDKYYVRIPQQDPVYVVNLDGSVFSTKFEDWIEKDLLQLSSIDITNLEMQNYDAVLGGNGSVSLNRTYDAELSVDSSNAWELVELTRYDEQQEPQPVTLAEGETLATARLNEIKNALDDLKIVDVAAKPKGMSENLKADKDLVSDNEAVRSLAVRGFFPISSGDVISANGEMNVTLNNGVQYVLRFGNVEGLSEESDAEGASGGANRYLLVTAQVDETKFPAPDLRPIPKSIEELEAMTQAQQASEAADTEAADAGEDATQPAADAPDSATEQPAGEGADAVPPAPAPTVSPADADAETPAEPSESETPALVAPAEGDAEPQAATEPAEPEDAAPEEPAEPVLDDADACGPQEETAEAEAAEESEAGDDAEAADAEATEAVTEVEPAAPAPAEPAAAEATPAAQAPAAEPSDQPAPVVETEEEKQERLEAEQEKITKENQRKLDERKDRIDAARRRVRELNGRFADWYYVIPESTYRKLRISMDDLIETPADAAAAAERADQDASAAPSFSLPGLP